MTVGYARADSTARAKADMISFFFLKTYEFPRETRNIWRSAHTGESVASDCCYQRKTQFRFVVQTTFALSEQSQQNSKVLSSTEERIRSLQGTAVHQMCTSALLG